MRNKKSYMNTSSILSENFIKDLFQLVKRGNLRALMRMTKNPQALRALKDLNDAAAALEKIGKKKFGPSYKRHRYKLIDFFR
jgi:uncharacterized protein YbjQ (UPF0145 family)